MSKGNATAAIRVTSKPKETTRVKYREADKDMHVNTYFGGFLGAKKRIPKAGKERNEADKGQGMTFRRGLAQVTTAFSDEAIKGKYGPSDVIGWFQPRSLALRGGQEDFGLNVAYGLQEGPTLSCQGLVSCHPLRMQAPKCLL